MLPKSDKAAPQNLSTNITERQFSSRQKKPKAAVVVLLQGMCLWSCRKQNMLVCSQVRIYKEKKSELVG